MKFRVARHTTQLPKIASFYKSIIGLIELGSFNNHDGYDGIFLGNPDESWHLEFTMSEAAPTHKTDDDDFLVFYVDNKAEQNAIREKCINSNIELLTAKNPYWNQDGLVISDPDGFKIIIAVAV